MGCFTFSVTNAGYLKAINSFLTQSNGRYTKAIHLFNVAGVNLLNCIFVSNDFLKLCTQLIFRS